MVKQPKEKTVPTQRVPIKESSGVSSTSMKAVGRNMARAMNQRGKK